MYPTTFHESEIVISPPPGQHEEISGLRVLPVLIEGSRVLVSCWKLTDAERQAIANGADIYLGVMSNVQPPVTLTTNRGDLGI